MMKMIKKCPKRHRRKGDDEMDMFKLEYEMKSGGITIECLCEHIVISRAVFYRKCNGISEFTQSEIQKIVDYVGLESPMGIF